MLENAVKRSESHLACKSILAALYKLRRYWRINCPPEPQPAFAVVFCDLLLLLPRSVPANSALILNETLTLKFSAYRVILVFLFFRHRPLTWATVRISLTCVCDICALHSLISPATPKDFSVESVCTDIIWLTPPDRKSQARRVQIN